MRQLGMKNSSDYDFGKQQGVWYTPLGILLHGAQNMRLERDAISY